MTKGTGSMASDSDTQLEKLVELARAGDLQANTLLIEHSGRRLLKLTRTMFHRYPSLRRWEQTDDVFQNALLRLHRALADVQPESVRHFFNLAGEMVRRELLDLKKHHFGAQGHAANHHTDHQPSDDTGGALARTAAEPDDSERWERFHGQVEDLPEDLREVVNLLFYEGLTQREAAEVLGVSLRTVKRRWQEVKFRVHPVRHDEPR
jgi:RNA polymerase sigma factor (sigma-70 family)